MPKLNTKTVDTSATTPSTHCPSDDVTPINWQFPLAETHMPRHHRSGSVRIEQICCRSVLGISQHSGPSVYRKATQTARNLTTWGIQIGREPFFGKFPYVPFPTQRYRGTWPFSRLPRSPHSNFNRSKRVRVSSLSEFCRHSYDFHEYRTRPGRNSHTMFVQKTFFYVCHAGVRYIAEYPAELNAPAMDADHSKHFQNSS